MEAVSMYQVAGIFVGGGGAISGMLLFILKGQNKKIDLKTDTTVCKIISTAVEKRNDDVKDTLKDIQKTLSGQQKTLSGQAVDIATIAAHLKIKEGP